MVKQSQGQTSGSWGTYLSGHGRQVPDTADNGPAGHHSQQVRHHPIFAAVKEGITELRVILKNSGKLMVRSQQL